MLSSSVLNGDFVCFCTGFSYKMPRMQNAQAHLSPVEHIHIRVFQARTRTNNWTGTEHIQ